MYLHAGNSEQPQKGPYFPERLVSLPFLQVGQGRLSLTLFDGLSDFVFSEESSIVCLHFGYLEQPKKFPNFPVRFLILPSCKLDKVMLDPFGHSHRRL